MNLSWITEDLAIGGRLDGWELERAGAAGIGAVVDLRSEAVDEAAILHAQRIAFLHLPTDDHAPVSPSMLDEGVDFARSAATAARRLLVHCEHGIGRSATLALCIMVDRGFAPLAALRHAKDRRECVSPSPAQYECWRAWLETRQAARGDPLDIPDFDRFAAIAYRHLPAAARR